jgi:hypothetical protein
MSKKEEVFQYLDDLRESGIINMWGSPRFLQEEFGMSRDESRDWVFQWMDEKATATISASKNPAGKIQS